MDARRGDDAPLTTLLIDADGLAFRAAAAVQKNIHWEDDVITSHADVEEAKEAFEGLLAGCVDAVDVSAEIVLAFSCPTRHYFRHDLLPTYKANRKGGVPQALPALRAWASETYRTYTKPNLEADDVLGILATHPKLIRGEKIVVSADKDLGQIPGLHLNPSAPHEGVYRITERFAQRLLWSQVLTGDVTDNYPGCPGIGPKKVGKYLDPNPLRKKGTDPGTVEGRVLEAFIKAGLTAEDMAIQVNVARILTASTYDFKRKEPILWQMT